MKILKKRVKPEGLELSEKIIIINRVAKVVKVVEGFLLMPCLLLVIIKGMLV